MLAPVHGIAVGATYGKRQNSQNSFFASLKKAIFAPQFTKI
jgi:hypothetical protein